MGGVELGGMTRLPPDYSADSVYRHVQQRHFLQICVNQFGSILSTPPTLISSANESQARISLSNAIKYAHD
ncbi:hypothetical protein CHUV2995_01421 [Corynebacterium diphtheriae subsp. lausannense]|nr:hypothetical protein CHUV2995_01421 [Corynebacterium diphtheriae subsp. lausannense]